MAVPIGYLVIVGFVLAGTLVALAPRRQHNSPLWVDNTWASTFIVAVR